jgi:predicted Rossmann fold flavoprotein
MDRFDVIVIGAGAAGLMCAGEAARRGRRTLVLDHAAAPGEKIRISGGGRCNFTNLDTRPERFLSQNPRFCASSLSRFTPADFVARVNARGIAWHEKAQGQLFCDGSARQIVGLLVDDLREAGGELRLGSPVQALDHADTGFTLRAGGRDLACPSLVVATGGKSIPKMGATGFGYDVARRFGLEMTPTRPGLVPLTFETGLLERLKPLAGVATPARVRCNGAAFAEPILFTHRGVSGPSVLQVSSYWREGDALEVDLAPGTDVLDRLKTAKREAPRQALSAALADPLPRRLAKTWAEADGADVSLAEAPEARLRALAGSVNRWRVKPVGSEGYRTAEVTVGGVDTRALDQRTFEARGVRGLHFIGEVVDVTGWLGGYNFQWAWASGWCAGQAA